MLSGDMSLAIDTNTVIERAISGLSLQTATTDTSGGGVGGMIQQNVTSRLFIIVKDHLAVSHVEAITADFAGWVCDSLSVSQNPGTRG